MEILSSTKGLFFSENGCQARLQDKDDLFEKAVHEKMNALYGFVGFTYGMVWGGESPGDREEIKVDTMGTKKTHVEI